MANLGDCSPGGNHLVKKIGRVFKAAVVRRSRHRKYAAAILVRRQLFLGQLVKYWQAAENHHGKQHYCAAIVQARFKYPLIPVVQQFKRLIKPVSDFALVIVVN